MTQHATLDFWFDFSSTYSYLSVMRIGDMARKAGVTVHWHPFLLGPVAQHYGWTASTFVLHPEMGTYMWADLKRQCKKYGLPWHQPTEFPRRSLLPMRIASLGRSEAWCEAFCKEVMLCNFARDRNIDDRELMAEILASLGLEAGAILQQTTSETTKAQLRRATDAAIKYGIFGAPSFIVGNDLYWGNDRLEDALSVAVQDRR